MLWTMQRAVTGDKGKLYKFRLAVAVCLMKGVQNPEHVIRALPQAQGDQPSQKMSPTTSGMTDMGISRDSWPKSPSGVRCGIVKGAALSCASGMKCTSVLTRKATAFTFTTPSLKCMSPLSKPKLLSE